MFYTFCIPATLLCAAAFAQAPLDPTIPSNTNPNSTGDSHTTGSAMSPDPIVTERAFLRRAADRSLILIELGKLAQEKGSTDRVKQFGKRLVTDAERTRKNLAPVAALLKVEVPSEVTKGNRKTLDRVANLSGPEFDYAFAKMVLNARKADIPSFDHVAQTGSTPEVRNFAARTLPALERERHTAEEIAAHSKR